ncbi:MAG: 3-oxoacyl-ACP synthase [Bacteroidota bacterium]|jgi:transcription elongation GreA/GreB family factor|nr:3-oxoacyl-ACP synthase [Bacteroidota bacterium]
MQKQKLIEACNHYFRNKIASLMSIIGDIENSSNSENKSSAGDKHETSKAMMQLEREKLGTQLREAENQLAEFEKIDFNRSFQVVEQGCLVETGEGLFFIAGSAGRLVLDDQTAFVISIKSPLANVMLGHKKGDTVLFNGVSYFIKSVS